MNILRIAECTKKFGKLTAVDKITLEVEQGEIFGLLGPNGAGKSTTINMISGLLKWNSGDIKILDQDINLRKIKRSIGVVPQDIAVYAELTAVENVMFFGSLYGLKGKELKQNSLEALEFVGLLDKKDMTPSKFSGGMKRRLNIACALAHKPKLVIMDEPTVGIDPQSRNHILESIKKLNKEGTTIIYTSHYMEEVEAICSRIAIMDMGKVIALGTKDELKNKFSETEMFNLKVKDFKDELKGVFESIQGVLEVEVRDEIFNIKMEKQSSNMENLLSKCINSDVTITNIEKVNIDLETVFLNLTGRSLRD